ncbi:unnamed protein product [Miscanthus lutarioriparius]|uniref:UV radiation resistance-associated gene protein n=1 Tax=Miscanthus lutarioriparius TaxID=422564 RepID=A0A811RLP9_9POAL|nr:unnamed protein product [Miscanthus lutarioriparius]
MEYPAPSSAAPDPPLHPPPSMLPHPQPPEEEGDGWVLVPASEVEGAHAPKVIHWDDLQQELARLWSLSAALQPAGDRKAHLAARLESALQVRQEFLEQDNELAEMRQRLQGHTDRLGDLKLRTKKLSEDVVDHREQLCVKIRTLSVASKALDAAHGNAESGLPNGSQNRPLVILGLQLSKLSVKKTGYFSDKTGAQKSSTVLGYAAHAVSLIASYLNVPLRYPLRFGGSRSYVLVPAPSVEPSSITSVATSVPPSTSMRTVEFPLFLDSQETTRSAYAIFLLNKDIEQLLNYIGAESLGPRHVLANLRQLTRIIQSQEYTSVD